MNFDKIKTICKRVELYHFIIQKITSGLVMTSHYIRYMNTRNITKTRSQVCYHWMRKRKTK